MELNYKVNGIDVGYCQDAEHATEKWIEIKLHRNEIALPYYDSVVAEGQCKYSGKYYKFDVDVNAKPTVSINATVRRSNYTW